MLFSWVIFLIDGCFFCKIVMLKAVSYCGEADVERSFRPWTEVVFRRRKLHYGPWTVVSQTRYKMQTADLVQNADWEFPLFFRLILDNMFYHINCGAIQEFPTLRKAFTTHVKKYRIFSRVDIANQLLTRHSPLAPLSQVDEWTANPSQFLMQVVCLRILELRRLIRIADRQWGSNFCRRGRKPVY